MAFLDHGLMFYDDDRSLLVAKRTADRQIRRLNKADVSTGLNPDSRDFKMDLYFQRFIGRDMQKSLDSILG